MFTCAFGDCREAVDFIEIVREPIWALNKFETESEKNGGCKE